VPTYNNIIIARSQITDNAVHLEEDDGVKNCDGEAIDDQKNSQILKQVYLE